MPDELLAAASRPIAEIDVLWINAGLSCDGDTIAMTAANQEARARMIAISGGQRMVPILAEEGNVVKIGWQGRGCVIAL